MFSLCSIALDIRWQKWSLKSLHLQRYYDALFDQLKTPIALIPLVAIDLEMTGLNSKQDQIVSIAVVPIIDGQIQLNQAKQRLLRITGSVGQSATIHGLLDKDLDSALSLEEAIYWLLDEIQGKVIIAHHAPLDLSFIETAIEQVLHEKCKLFAIDTLQIERQRLLRQQDHIQQGELRLGSVRHRYNLPIYNAHNALIDALACAELFLAQLSQLGDKQKIKVIELLK
ncbi:exonuclease domain-containing protein [Psychromonas sp. MME2]|uniref:exonuclease domain-containing protein n=1 Tax=unclassified Psychromonas TaxID=2614957 RepID=UPI00339C7964